MPASCYLQVTVACWTISVWDKSFRSNWDSGLNYQLSGTGMDYFLFLTIKSKTGSSTSDTTTGLWNVSAFTYSRPDIMRWVASLLPHCLFYLDNSQTILEIVWLPFLRLCRPHSCTNNSETIILPMLEMKSEPPAWQTKLTITMPPHLLIHYLVNMATICDHL